MNKDDRLKKADIMNRLREGRETSNPVTINEFCELLRLNGLLHNHGYFHYTTWGRLQKMLTEVETAEKEKKRLFFLSSSSSLNDTEEKRDGFYVASFSVGEEEEVAMWTNYGVPKSAAIRIRFPMKAMTRWMRENSRDAIAIYVQENGEQQFHALNVKPVDVYFADVAYYGRNDSVPDTTPDTVRYRGQKYRLDEDKWRDRIRKTNYSLLFKKRGWSYESEVRLIVQFDEVAKMRRYKKIAVVFDSVYDEMLDVQRQKGCSLMYGPWYKKGKCKLPKIKGISISCNSSFTGELRMRSVCDDCPNKDNFENCNCQEAEWKLYK